ncbi:MAG: hypothetical protein L6R38_004073 [Xanthoria sp. 2 TBL-2021]|nr:MAG: hypothetical protein L6R38_004073 [Xanthoria sp. 2 TBL-2021]
MFAIYVDSVSSVPYSSERSTAHSRLLQSIDNGSASTAGIRATTHSAGLVNNETYPSVDANGPRSEVTTLQELEAIKTVATAQAKAIASETLNFLADRGFTLKDFAVWNWILSSRTAVDAALRLELVRKTPCETTAGLDPVPLFVYQRLLLRNDMSAEALSIFIRQIWQLLSPKNQQNSHSRNAEQNEMQKKIIPIGLDAFTTMIVRLLRHTRKVWPAAITNIAKLWVTHARDNGRNNSRLSFHYNRILQIIALPSNESPYQSLHHRQHAYFIVYRRMLESSSRFTINREGYRAFTQIQLAHRKTESEREWARLKGPTWPPWKADRTGMDADIGADSGVSRATTVLRHATAWGYGPKVWERGAGILAGIDTDQSPTIQTRSTVVPGSSSSLPRGSISSLPPGHTLGLDHVSKKLQPEAAAIWTARVKATRTLQEAWVCFLACKDQGITMGSQLYEAMIEKVIYNDKRRPAAPNDADPESTPEQLDMPGDGKEVADSSASHNQAISTREPLPTINSLLEKMISHGVRPNDRLVRLVLTHTRSYEEGVQVLEVSRLCGSVRTLLLRWQERPWDQAAISDAKALLKTLPDWLFAAYIDFLCRFAERATVPDSESVYIQERLRHAFRLVLTRLPLYRPPWNSLLRLLSRHGSRVVVNKRSQLQQEVVKFERACRLLDSTDSLNLDMDFTGFSYLCAIVSNANAKVKACAKQRVEVVKTRFAQLVRPSTHVHGGLNTVARLSDYCCSDSRGIDSASRGNVGPAPLPRLFRTPHPAHLHVYIRCLGHHDDCDGLVELMQWLAVFADEVIVEAKELANGRTMFGRCLTALRAFGCNESIQSTEEQTQRYECALESLREVMDIREDRWVRWPTDVEVERYFHSP